MGKPGGKYGGDKSREGFDSKTREVKLNTPSEYKVVNKGCYTDRNLTGNTGKAGIT